jgi:hypothetical protein
MNGNVSLIKNGSVNKENFKHFEMLQDDKNIFTKKE